MPNHLLVEYRTPSDAFRALGVLMGRIGRGTPMEFGEEPAVERPGVMIDVSRNGVLKVASIRKLIRHFALMGFQTLMLYTEDTYEVPGEPLFGYFRGRYSQAELREIDEYAAIFGIEVVPCIQTLGHMEQFLHWPATLPLRDTPRILLSEDEPTYVFIRKMLEAASAPFRSKRIHIGMDEANGIGSGRFRSLKGPKEPFEILSSHLQQLTKICQEMGLRPLIWSDKYFRLGSPKHDYYDEESVIPESVSAQIPAEAQLVYWDYYHWESAFYEEWIRRHRAMGKEPIFAAGIRAWSRFWTALPSSFQAIEAGMEAAVRQGVKEALLTVWFDDGTECDFYSTLPAFQRFADLAYGVTSRAESALNLKGSSGLDQEAWIQAAYLDIPPDVVDPARSVGNYSKWILWHDPILNFFGQHIPAGLAKFYRDLAVKLRALAESGGAERRRLEFPALLAEALEAKLVLRERVEVAYANRDAQLARQIRQGELVMAEEKVTQLWNAHRVLWQSLYKPFGWETLERRYGTLLARLKSLALMLDTLADDPAVDFPEFEVPAQPIFHHKAGEFAVNYATCSAPSVIQ